MISETVPAALAGERVDRVVAFISDCSRAEAASLIEQQAVRRNGIPVRKGADRVDEGDVVDVDDSALAGPDLPVADAAVVVPLLFEDQHVLVVDKPAGLVVHPGSGTPAGTMVNGLLARYPELAGVGDPTRPGIVHRLDKGTSGALVVARSPLAYESLVGQLQDRTMERRYLAIVVGHLESDRGVIDARLGRSRRNPQRQAVVADGRDARTHYVVLSRHDRPFPVTVVQCRLETGRTHQIRVHLAAIGHPVLADDTYGRGHPAVPIDRPALHAELLGFAHPATGEHMRFESPVPEDLQTLLDALGPARDVESVDPGS